MTGVSAPGPRVRGTALRGALTGLRRQVGVADVGSLPVLIGLVALWAIFSAVTGGVFVTPFNLVNLALQMAATGTIAIGVVFVLLLGEIDLTVGIVSGLGSAVMAVLNTKMGVPGELAIAAGILTGTFVGLFQGAWITGLRIPSFVVTLAGLIAWQGALLFILGSTGAINLTNATIIGLANTFFDGPDAWAIGALFVASIALAGVMTRRRRRAVGLAAEGPARLAARIVILGAVVAVALAVLQADRGLPLSVVLFVGLSAVMDAMARRTRFGRMVFAVGGNAEAARRAGVPVSAVRVAVFALASTFAAFGGLLAASRLLAVNQSSGGGDVLLNAIAAAVIGGTSLFGGRGTVWAALLGVAVIQTISNGMDLLSLSSSIKFMITGGVLLTAVTIDAVARRGREISR